ncbi:MAG: Hsp33 family molecular chaperone HslO [Erysipelotrichaceae bacterium]|nr:Hsp33 family molecular chaperone HslO [Erysipelotrichaceae bacterium]
MKDEIIIASAMNNMVRIHAASTTALCEEANRLHDMRATSCAALGRTMTAAALIASDLKNPQEHVVVTINGGGPIGKISVQADGQGNVRGYTENPGVYLFRESDRKLDVGAGVGTNGTLTVSRDMGLKEPFTGVVNLTSGEIANDFAYYFAISEQTPSVVALGVLVETDGSVRAAGGMIIQLMPGAGEDVISAVEKIAGTMKPMSAYIDARMTPKEIISELFDEPEFMEERPVQWHCGCSKEKFADGLMLVDEKDLLKMIHEDHGAEAVCQFCSKKYRFSEEDLEDILERHRHVENRQRFH